MVSLNGPISDRLRKKFPPDAKEWNPGRPADVEPVKGPIPKGVQGESIDGRKK